MDCLPDLAALPLQTLRVFNRIAIQRRRIRASRLDNSHTRILRELRMITISPHGSVYQLTELGQRAQPTVVGILQDAQKTEGQHALPEAFRRYHLKRRVSVVGDRLYDAAKAVLDQHPNLTSPAFKKLQEIVAMIPRVVVARKAALRPAAED